MKKFLFCAILFFNNSVMAVTSFLWSDSSGDWLNGANWLGGTFPNAVDTEAFFGAVTGTSFFANININAAIVTVTTLSFAPDTNSSYNIFGGDIQFQSISGPADIRTDTVRFNYVASNPLLTSELLVHGVSFGYTTISGQIHGSSGVTLQDCTLELQNGTNAYSGNTTINAGSFGTALLIANSAGICLPTNTIVNSGELRFATNNNQIASTANITVSGGLLNFTTTSQSFNQLFFSSGSVALTNSITLNTGPAITLGDVNLPNASSGTINLSEGVSANDIIYNGAGSGGAIQSNLNLGASSRVINVGVGSSSNNIDLNISGVISAGGALLTKTGNGRLQFSGASPNTYTGDTSVSTGIIRAAKSTAFTSGTTVTVADGAALEVTGGVTNNPILSLSGSGIGGNGALRNISGDNTFSNTISASSTTIQSDAGNLTLSGLINVPFVLSINGPGRVIVTNGGNLVNQITVNTGGLVRAATNNNVLTSGDLVLVSDGGALEVIDGISNNPILSLEGSGIGGTGALRNISGDNTFSNTVSLSNFPVTMQSDLNTLILSGVIQGNQPLTTQGIGAIQFSGSAANTYSALTTVSAGTLQLNKTAGTNAIAGDATISGGTLQLLAANQIANTSNVNLSSGTFNLNANAETINSLTFNGGTLTQGGSPLSLAATTTALTMRNTTISGSLNLTSATSGGNDINFDNTNNGTATISGALNLFTAGAGSITRTFNVANGSASIDMDVSGVISQTIGGSAAVTKTGLGTLQFSGAAANTYSGLTTVSAGTLQLNKTAGTNAIAGDATISGGTLQLSAANQLPDTSNVTLSSGTFDLNANAETINSLTFNGGTLSQGGATLSLAATTAALTMRDTTISGSLNLTSATSGGNDINFDNTNNGTATISGALDLFTAGAGSITRTFNIANGSAAIDMDVSSVISQTAGGSAAVTKTGLGTLQFSGASANTYSGLTTVSTGTLQLNKTAGVNAIAGDATISGGTLQLSAANQIADTSNVTLSSGTFDLNANAETIGTLTFNGGTLSQGGGNFITCCNNCCLDNEKYNNFRQVNSIISYIRW